MKVFQGTLALKNLCVLLEILTSSSPNHEYRNVLLYSGNSTVDIVSSVLSASLSSRIPWMYFNVDETFGIKILGIVRMSTINLVFLQNLEEIYLARRIKKKAAHTIIISNGNPQNLLSIEETMKALVRYRVFNAALLFWRNTTEIWTSNHFHDMYSILVYSSGINFTVPPNLHERVFVPKTRDLNGKELDVFGYHKPPKMVKFPEYLSKDFPGVDYGGRDGFLAYNIAKKLNAKLNYSLSEIHNVSENTTNAVQFVDNLSRDVFKFTKRPDLILMSSYSELHSTDFELLQPHDIDCVSIIIPSIGKPLLIGIGEVLAIPIVKLSPIILILIVIVWYIILFVNEPKRMDGPKVILDTLGIFLRTKTECNVRTLSEKILLMALLVFTIIMGALFTEFVYHNLVNPPFKPNIDTLDELIDSGTTIWAENYVHQFLKEIGNTTNGKVLQQIVITDRPIIIAGILAKNMSQGYALLHSTIEMHLKNKEMWVHGVNVFHEISECLIPMQVAFKIAENCLLREPINEILLDFSQLGFFQHFRRMETYLLNIMNISHSIPEPQIDHIAFTLDMSYFVDIFLFLIAGLFISFLAFLGEITFHRYKRFKQKERHKKQ